MFSTDQFRSDIMAENQLKGPDAKYIKIISSDNHEFIIKKEVALTSGDFEAERGSWLVLGTIKAMLSGPGVFQEQETNEIHFQEIPSHVLSKGNNLFKLSCFTVILVCGYFEYRSRYTNSAMEIPEFPIAPEVALELLMAANFLDCWKVHLSNLSALQLTL